MIVCYIYYKDTKEGYTGTCILMQQKENVANCEG
jgi:hypothetical protein